MTNLEEKMGRLLAWLTDESHSVPLVSSETKRYIKRYMQAAINGQDTDKIPYKEATND